MYQINDRTWAIEEGDNIAFVRDGGGEVQLFAGDYNAMQTPDPDAGPHTTTEAEYIVLEVRKHAHEIPDSAIGEDMQLTPELRKQYDKK